MQLLREWFKRNFSDPQVIILVFLLLVGLGFILFLGKMLAPVLAGLIIAYLLEGGVRFLQRRKIPRFIGVLFVFFLFMFTLLLVLFYLLPLLTEQVGQLINLLPSMIARGQQELLLLPEKYPKLVSEEQVREVISALRLELMSLGQRALSLSLASLINLIAFLVYLVLVPLLVFFFLKDKSSILDWFKQFLPEHTGLATEVWQKVNLQIGNYVRGKVWEIGIVWASSYLVFTLLDLQFAMLISLIVGLSVIIPYIGATVVTLPVAMVAYYQWGWSADLLYIMIAYGIIQLLDGNVLVPVLLGEVVNLHPIAIIVAILIFGGLWGFWGVFFAIPLATLVQSVINSISEANKKKQEDVPAP